MKSLIIVFLTNFSLIGLAQGQSIDLKGAWETGVLENQTVLPYTTEITMICSEKYFAVAIYDIKNKKFVGTHGGSYRVEGNEFIAVIEFHSMNPELVGKELRNQIQLKKGTLTFHDKSENIEWKQIDNGKPGQLAGAWLITGRVREGQMRKMTPGARRNMKILSGTHFQWIAYNVETKEFSGTGGGTYTTEDGKYTENIEFFSRDNSRAGKSLIFDFSIEDGNWRHKGFSSKGDAIDEVWTKREKIGL